MDGQKDQQTNHAPTGHAIINIKNEPISDGIEFDNNPWNVESLHVFLSLKCPECVFDTKEKNSFRDHAIEKHPLSIVLFERMLKEGKNYFNEFNLEGNFLADKIDSENPLESEQDYNDYSDSNHGEFDYEYTEDNDQTNEVKQEREICNISLNKKSSDLINTLVVRNSCHMQRLTKR